ncbi:FdhF/YdeP family oxidoreductase [Novosphingopyxis sp.]|uniref:FdhF/YdeP family oxidoreductase n=1 Tax=Novosphingopyxis sp. TaxID=2709690 RepID=UPI003B5BC83E
MSDTRDPANKHDDDMPHYDGPAGGWGSLKGIAKILGTEKPSPGMFETLQRQNKTGGHMCTSCAWAKPAKPHPFEFCENGAKATLWELTSKRCTPQFFSTHSVSELRRWKDYDLEIEGRLTHPMRYDPETDHYVPASWDEAFRAIGAHLKKLDPKSVIFYASGRASLETSYLYALFARVYGHNNLPDSSNMCHETTSVALTKVIGAPVGTCTLDDFEHCDAIFFFGQNTGSNSPRFLHPLQAAVKRGCRIVTFNPLKEKGLEEFVDPQNPVQMLSGKATEISYQYHQVKAGGDIAAILGMCKFILECDAARRRNTGSGVIDEDFIAEHTHGFDEFKAKCETTDWDEIEANCGLSRTALMDAARVYMDAEKVIGIYGMGLTQHVHGFENIGLLTNFLLLRGNIGRPGAGMSPVRGHSNVQGQRTVGIAEKTKLVPLDTIAAQFGFEPPREDGMNTVEACEGILDGSVKAFVSLGGNFVRAIPEREKMEHAWQEMELTVQIATKLNRSHLINGKSAWLLPCLARSERDMQATGAQQVTMEDTFSHVYASLGKRPPASDELMSELAIVAGLAKETVAANPKLKWDAWTGDYALVRDLIAETYHDEFYDMNERMNEAGGFYRGNSARERIWKTASGRAEFTTPAMLSATGVEDREGRFRLITLRSNDQFNTTIYGYSDRFRGIEGTRHVVLINPGEMAQAGLRAGQRVSLIGDADDGADRRVSGLTVTPYETPDGCLGGYFPELNPLVPLWYHDERSKTPASKGVPVRIEAD